MDKKHIGACNEMAAASWLLRQGYEVFRNVSAHGIIDIITVKDGKVELLDVKAVPRYRDGNVGARLTQRQIDLGVKMLAIDPDGVMSIVASTTVSRQVEEGSCLRCGKAFLRRERKKIYCSSKCRLDQYNGKPLESPASEAAEWLEGV